jgi:tetratricopeptide (TPR) repeat protein
VLSGDYANGIDLLKKAVERQPEDPTAWIGIASAYQGWTDERDSPEAIAALDIADSLTEDLIRNSRDADLASAYHNKALIHELRGEWDQAAQAYGKAADRFGNQQAAAYNSLVQKASAARRTGEYEIARDALRAARQLDWSAPWAYLERAQLASEGEESEFAARFWLSNAEAVAPEEPYVYIALADICEKWQRYACAERAFARAADLYSQSGWLQSRIGDFYQPENPPQSHQSWQLAADHYERAVELRPKDPLMHERYGFALHSLGRLEEAIDEYGTAVDLAPPDTLPSRLYCNLAVLEREANLHDAAEASEAKCREREVEIR